MGSPEPPIQTTNWREAGWRVAFPCVCMLVVVKRKHAQGLDVFIVCVSPGSVLLTLSHQMFVDSSRPMVGRTTTQSFPARNFHVPAP